jgi:lipoprotein NlpD
MNKILFIIVSIFLFGCASKIPAPVDNGNDKKKESSQKKIVCPDIYEVKQSETLFSISIKCGFDYEKVATANGLKKPYFVKKGDQIRFDILRKKSIKKMPESNDVQIIPFEEEVISEDNQTSIEFIFGDPISIAQPKAIKEIYSKKSIKKANKIIAEKYKISRSWKWPTDSPPVNSFDSSASKKGIEFYGVPGQEVRSVARGKVIYAGEDLEGYGRLLIIKHDGNILSVYGHQKELLVKEGDEVIAGQTIGTMGSSGTDMVKLHFEIRQNGKSIDPIKFLKKVS